MPDFLGANGLQLKTYNEIKSELEDAFKIIYGEDISLDQDTPDGQLIGILAQIATDQREKLLEIYSSFDPDQATGAILDQRVGINGILRNEGSYTRTPVTITTDRALTLDGVDTSSNPYTIKDDAGTLFVLEETAAIVAAGDHILNFRAKDIGKILIGLNTITTAETIVAGVTGINNPDAPIIIGQDEEPDDVLKERRKKSVAISSKGYLDSIEAALANVDGVTTATVIENNTDGTDSDGTPAHTIWALVEGGNDADIAQAIYSKKSAGAGMRGSEEVVITRENGRSFTVKFDRPVQQDLYIRFNLIISGGLIDYDFIKDKIVEELIWKVGEDAAADQIICYIKSIDQRLKITGVEVSKDGATWAEVVEPDTITHRFVNDQARITIT